MKQTNETDVTRFRAVPGEAPGRRGRLRFFALAALGLVLPGVSGAVTIDFQDLSLPEDSFWNGSEAEDGSQGFTSRGAVFNNEFTDEFGFDSWSGWAYSNVLDQETAGFENQYAAIAGLGTGENGIYGVAFDSSTARPAIELPAGTYPESMTVANTTYAYLSMLEGDDFSKQFTVEDQDWFRLDVRGLDAQGNETGIVPFYLADFRFESEEDAYIIDDWTSVDLSALGEATRSLEFALASSDVGEFGINTPTYFAMGDMTAVPEPASFALFAGIGIGVMVFLRRRRAGRPAA